MSRLLRCLGLLFALGLLTAVARPSRAQSTEARLISPLPGQALRGQIAITVDGLSADLQSVQVLFAYANDRSDTWFLLHQANLSLPPDGTPLELTQWDTSTISDGNYSLRVILGREDGSNLTLELAGLRVRNYSPVESDTPTPPPSPTLPPTPGGADAAAATLDAQTITPAPAVSATPAPTHTATPSATAPPTRPIVAGRNPAALAQGEVLLSIAQGVLGVVGLFSLFLLARILHRPRDPNA